MPEPNFIAITAENGHGHCAVLLAMPVGLQLQQESNLRIFATRLSAALPGAPVPIAIISVS